MKVLAAWRYSKIEETMAGDGKTVVLIDDNADLARSYQEILCLEGYHALVAESGPAALELLSQMDPPHLLLIDCLMPDMSGEEFLRALECQNPRVFATSVIVGFTSFVVGTPWLSSLAGKVSQIVEKPHDIDEFLTMVRTNTGG